MTTALVAELAGRGLADCAVAVLDPPGSDAELLAAMRAAAPVTELPPRRLGDPRTALAVARLARETRADVLHAHLVYSAVAARAAGLLVRRPQLTSIHTAPAPRAHTTALRTRLDRVTARWSTAFAAPSAELAQASAAWYGLPGERFTVVPNAVADRPVAPGFDRAALRAELGASEGELLVLCLARLDPAKGIDELLDAAPGLDGVRIAVAGRGAEEERLAARIRDEALADRVALLGFRADVGELLGAADAYCLPSRHEALPISLLEAMAAGLPCVATAVGAVPEVLAAGDAGIVVAPRSPGELAAALAGLAEDREAAALLGARGRERVREHYGMPAAAERYAALYRDLVARGRG